MNLLLVLTAVIATALIAFLAIIVIGIRAADRVDLRMPPRGLAVRVARLATGLHVISDNPAERVEDVDTCPSRVHMDGRSR